MFRKPTRKTPTGEAHGHDGGEAGSVAADISYIGLPIAGSLVEPPFDHTLILAFYG